MDDVTIARALHIVAVVHWIGGVAFVTTVVLPAVSALTDPSRRLELFEAVEQRFSAQVKISVPVAGLTGAYMADRLDSWGRFVAPDSWWLTAMAVVWIVFMVILFVIEPLVLRNWIRHAATARPASMFRAVQRAHWGLLAMSTVTVAAGVLGAHGLLG
jgi:uncharacterized membrane protein